MTDYKAIFAIGIFAMLALAGVAVLADDASADEDISSGFINDSKGDYTVTYTYGGSSIVKKMSSGNQFQFSVADISGFDAPKGYEFDEAFIDQKSGAVYNCTSPYTFTSDIIVEPEVAPAQAIVKLVYGDISAEYMSGSDKTNSYTVTSRDLEDFAEKIGATVVETNKSITGFAIDGYKFDGFKPDVTKEDNADLTKVLTAEGVGITTYTLVMEKVYNVTFVADGVTVSEQTTNDEIKVPQNSSVPNYDFIGWSDGVKTYEPLPGQNVVDLSSYVFTKDTVFTAVFKEKVYDATFIIGDKTEVRSAKYNKPVDAVPLPEGYAYYALADDETKTKVAFPYTVTGPVTFVAIEGVPAVTFNVTFQIEGKTDVTQKSDSLTIPDVTREGYEFQGWVVAGTSKYVDPTKYEYTADVTFVAIYKQIGYSTVTFIIGEEVIEISVKNGTTIPADKIPELDPAVYSGWNFDINMVIDQSQSFKAVPILYHKVVFEYGADTGIPSVTVEVADGTTIPADKIPVIPAQLGDVRWDYSNSTVRDDMTIGLVDVVYPEEPGFFDTTSGKIAGAIILLAVLVVIALLVAPASPMNYKIVKGKVAGVIEARRADKKP